MPELSDKQAYQLWAEYVENIRKQTAAMQGESESQQRDRIKRLEANPEEWFKYYFPQYCYADPAQFHKDATKRIVANTEWYEVRNWSRELAKDVRTMMEILYLMLTGKKKYMLMISNSWDAAERFLRPYQGNLEGNQRIIYDYGVQELPGSWSAGDFQTRKGFAFCALGAGQSPRGTRFEHIRPDTIVVNDIDTDEDCRNTDIINKRWDWIEKALIPTRSISNPLLVIFIGNIIAEDCCVVRASKYADHTSVVNIRDHNGNSSWPEKNTEEMIDRVLSKISYNAQQAEYFNNPIHEGRVFKEMTYGPVPDMRQFPFLVVYADPAPSNKDRPGIKAKIQNSCKAVVVVGYLENKYYVCNAFVDSTTNANFVDWLYAARNEVSKTTQPYFLIENNTLQDPFYQQVLLPLIHKKAKVSGIAVLGISPDARKKPDKYFRIEGTLEPLNRMGCLILNEKHKGNPHMQRLEAQFKSVSVNSKTMDGPDAVEGAVFIIQQKLSMSSAGSIKSYKRTENKKRY